MSSFLSVLGTVANVVSGFLCYTFKNQSALNLVLGLSGATTFGQPIYINQSGAPVMLTNWKCAVNTEGVSDPSVEGYFIALDTAGPVQSNAAEQLRNATAYNPTLAIPTFYAWALMVVKATEDVVDFNTPVANFNFQSLKDRLAAGQPSDTMPPSYANIVDNGRILFSDASGLYGHQTGQKYYFGFTDSKYPGPIILGAKDWIQIIYMASNNFEYPSLGIAGPWARLQAVFSFESQPPPLEGSGNDDPSRFTLNGPNSVYKQFNTIS
jgi:hypothetical protein